jgi:hypothetical protein
LNKTVVIGIVFVVVVIGFLIYSSMHLAQARVEVCMSFNGQTACRTASADTREHALRAATSNACAMVSSGVTDTMACERANPTSVQWK